MATLIDHLFTEWNRRVSGFGVGGTIDGVLLNDPSQCRREQSSWI